MADYKDMVEQLKLLQYDQRLIRKQHDPNFRDHRIGPLKDMIKQIAPKP